MLNDKQEFTPANVSRNCPTLEDNTSKFGSAFGQAGHFRRVGGGSDFLISLPFSFLPHTGTEPQRVMEWEWMGEKTT